MAPSLKLHYFQAQGRAEFIRFIFAYGKIQYEDLRYTNEEFTEKLKPKLPFEQIPVLEADGVFINQSLAIGRYAAKLAGIAGKTDIDAAKADAFIDGIWDLGPLFRDAFMGKPEALATALPKTLKALDSIIKENGGHSVNGQTTWADFVLATMFPVMAKTYSGDIAKDFPNVNALVEKVNNLPGIKEWIAKRPEDKHY